MAQESTGGTRNTRIIATIEKYRKTFADQTMWGNPWMSFLRERKLLETEELVGHEEVVPLMMPQVANARFFDDADVLHTAAIDPLKDARTGRANLTDSFYIGDIEQMENAGDAQILKLLEVKTYATRRSLEYKLSTALAGSRGSDPKANEGLRDVLGGATPDATPTTAGTQWASTNTSSLHGLAPSAISTIDYTYAWAPACKITTSVGTNMETFDANLADLFLQFSEAGSKPQLGLADKVYWTYFMKVLKLGLTPRVTYSGDRPMGKPTKFNPGVPDLWYDTAQIRYDKYVATPSTYAHASNGHCNYIDPDLLKVCFDPRWFFKLLKPRPRAGDDQQLIGTYRWLVRFVVKCHQRNAHGIHIIDVD